MRPVIHDLPVQAWAAGATLRWTLKDLPLDAGPDRPFHVLGFIFKAHIGVAQDAADTIEGYQLGALWENVMIRPNLKCELSSLSGRTWIDLVWALTGRRSQEPEDVGVGAATVQRTMAWFVPYHGKQFGVAGDFLDIVSPVERWVKQGNIEVVCSGATPFANNVAIDNAQMTVYVVLQGQPGYYQEAGNLMYGELLQDPAGTSIQYPSEGFTVFMGLMSPWRTAGADYGAVFASFDNCVLDRVSVVQQSAGWNMLVSEGGGGGNAAATMNDLQYGAEPFWPLIYARNNRTIGELPSFRRGDRLLELTAAGAGKHMLGYIQLAEAPDAHGKLARELGTEVPGPKLAGPLKHASDVVIAETVKGILPRRIEINSVADLAQPAPDPDSLD